MSLILDFLVRWGHGLFGITWIGFLYYFNFVQGGYFKKASPEALADAKQHLAPSALWWFRWGAAFTFLTGGRPGSRSPPHRGGGPLVDRRQRPHRRHPRAEGP